MTYRSHFRRLETEDFKPQLIVELATTTKTQAHLAREYGVGQSAISMFVSRHREEIEMAKLTGPPKVRRTSCTVCGEELSLYETAKGETDCGRCAVTRMAEEIRLGEIRLGIWKGNIE